MTTECKCAEYEATIRRLRADLRLQISMKDQYYVEREHLADVLSKIREDAAYALNPDGDK